MASKVSIGKPVFANFPLQIGTGILCASYWRGAWYVLDYSLFPTDRVKSGVTSLCLGGGILAMQQHMLSPSYNGTKFLVRLIPPPQNVSLRTYYIKMNRFISLYGIAMACILVWRGTWLLWDEGADLVSDSLSAFMTKKNSHNNNNNNNRSMGEPNVPLVPLAVPPIRNAETIITSVRDDAHHHAEAEKSAVTHHDIDKTLFYSGIASHVLATFGLLLIGRFKSVMAPPANVSMMKDIFLHGKGKDFRRAAQSFARTY
jgi:hypothetical protein